MGRTSKDAEFSQHLSSQTVLREHTLDRMLNDKLRLLLPHFSQAAVAFATDITREEHILVLLLFLACQRYLIGIDDHQEIAGIDVRCVMSVVAATDDVGCFNCETTKHLSFSIDQMPLGWLLGLVLSKEGFHEKRGQ